MIGTIRPLVQEAKTLHKWLGMVSLYTAGATLSSIVLGATLGSLGFILAPGRWSPRTILIIALIGLFMSLCDFQVGGMKTLTFGRQTCRWWWNTLGPSWAVLLWGIDLGLGFTTIRVASLYWVVALMVVVMSSPLLGAVILGAYGLAIALNLVIGLLFLEREGSSVNAHIQALRLLYPLKTSLAVVLLLWSIWLISISVRAV